MDKIKLRASALLLCIFLMCLFVIPTSAAEGNGGLFGLPREAESIVGDVTGAINDAIGEMTGDTSGSTDHGQGGSIPQDTSGVINDTDAVTDPVTTAPSTTDNRAPGSDTSDSGSGSASDAGNTSGDEGASGFIGIVIAIIAGIAVVLLIIALMPRKKSQ